MKNFHFIRGEMAEQRQWELKQAPGALWEGHWSSYNESGSPKEPQSLQWAQAQRRGSTPGSCWGSRAGSPPNWDTLTRGLSVKFRVGENNVPARVYVCLCSCEWVWAWDFEVRSGKKRKLQLIGEEAWHGRARTCNKNTKEETRVIPASKDPGRGQSPPQLSQQGANSSQAS